jgi:hypothetical protein
VSWEFVDGLNMAGFEFSEQPRQPNEIVVARFTPAVGIIGEGRGDQVGRQSVSFEPSRHVVCDHVSAVQGGLQDFVFFDAAGTVLAGGGGGNPGIYSGQGMAVRAEFTYLPTIGTAAYTPYWEILVRGGEFARESNYRFPASDSALQAAFGVFPASRASTDPVIGDEAGAALSALAYIYESSRRVYTGKFRTPYLNPLIRPGQRVRITSTQSRQAGTVWLVERVRISRRGAFSSMEIEVAKGL